MIFYTVLRLILQPILKERRYNEQIRQKIQAVNDLTESLEREFLNRCGYYNNNVYILNPSQCEGIEFTTTQIEFWFDKNQTLHIGNVPAQMIVEIPIFNQEKCLVYLGDGYSFPYEDILKVICYGEEIVYTHVTGGDVTTTSTVDINSSRVTTTTSQSPIKTHHTIEDRRVVVIILRNNITISSKDFNLYKILLRYIPDKCHGKQK